MWRLSAQCCPAAVLAPLSQSRGGMRMHQVTEEEVAWLRTDSAASWATKLAISWSSSKQNYLPIGFSSATVLERII